MKILNEYDTPLLINSMIAYKGDKSSYIKGEVLYFSVVGREVYCKNIIENFIGGAVWRYFPDENEDKSYKFRAVSRKSSTFAIPGKEAVYKTKIKKYKTDKNKTFINAVCYIDKIFTDKVFVDGSRILVTDGIEGLYNYINNNTTIPLPEDNPEKIISMYKGLSDYDDLLNRKNEYPPERENYKIIHKLVSFGIDDKTAYLVKRVEDNNIIEALKAEEIKYSAENNKINESAIDEDDEEQND